MQISYELQNIKNQLKNLYNKAMDILNVSENTF